MKKLIYTSIVILAATAAKADDGAPIVDGVTVGNFDMEHSGNYMTVDMTLDLKNLKVNSNRAVLLTPVLVNGNDSLRLPSVGVYGRRRYYYYVRNGESMLTGKDESSYMASKKPEEYVYHNIIPYEEWMNGAELSIRRSDYGCCNTLLAKQTGLLGHFTEQIAFFPELVYVQPEAKGEEIFSIEGAAFVDFPVDQTVIYPEYRRNTAELAKIQASIDSVRDDRYATIKEVWLKGYASPESPYAHNKELAIGRTAAIKDYIQQLYRFDDGIIATDYEPEDWAGLRRYVENSNINHKNEILAIIDSSLEPDAKELKIKSTYPTEYTFLLRNSYPALRHTDYRISYNIRRLSDPKEIEQRIKEAPQKLSLNEFYLVAKQYDPGTDEFTDVFETAVRMYPNDEIANLNAANAAIRTDNFAAAERYLAKSGNSAEAVYARAALAIRQGDIDKACGYLRKASALGLKQADVTLEELLKRNK